MKILVCLVSGQHVPNLLTVHEIKPDRLIMLVTPEMNMASKRFIKALEHGGLACGKRVDPIFITRSDIITDTKEALETALGESLKKHPDAEWVVNITGGTKPMSIGAYEFSKERGLRMLYIPERDQSRALDFSGGSDLKLNYHVRLMEFLAGYGFRIRNSNMIETHRTNAAKWFDLSSRMMANYEDEAQRSFLRRMWQIANSPGAKDEGVTLGPRDLLIGNAVLGKAIADRFGLEFKGGYLTGHLDRYMVHFLAGGWLEVFVWGLLEKFDGQSIWDPCWRVCAESMGGPVENEWDVVFMMDQSLYIVECKSSNQDLHQRNNREGDERGGMDVLYEIEAIRKQLGALRVRSFLATTDPRVLDPRRGGIKKRLKDRSNLYQCEIISGETLRSLAEMEQKSELKLRDEIARVFMLNQAVKR